MNIFKILRLIKITKIYILYKKLHVWNYLSAYFSPKLRKKTLFFPNLSKIFFIYLLQIYLWTNIFLFTELKIFSNCIRMVLLVLNIRRFIWKKTNTNDFWRFETKQHHIRIERNGNETKWPIRSRKCGQFSR